MLKRPPDRIIGDSYLHRWHLLPRNRWFNVYLHRYTGSDDDRALHDHPWHSVSFLLRGRLREHLQGGRRRVIARGWPVFRRPRMAHRLELLSEDALTLFITGPKVRDWGFYCPQGWRHWQAFTDTSGNRIGRGCD